jgi:hypothetical protein
MPSTLDTNVPIVGQGLRVIGYTVLPLVMCDCGHLEPLTLVAQVAPGNIFASLATCPRCQATYRVVGIAADAKGALVFNLDQKKPVLT